LRTQVFLKTLTGHGLSAEGKAIKRKLKRSELLAFFANYPVSLIGLEACGGAHHWASELTKLGHQVVLLNARYVKNFVVGNKNDFNDAPAIFDAVTRPNKRVQGPGPADQPPVQQQRLKPAISGRARRGTDLGHGKGYARSRDYAASLGVVPRRHSRGDKAVYLGISKRGNRYIRTKLIHGAQLAVKYCSGKTGPLNRWLQALVERRGFNKAVIALANKNARILWAMATKEQAYEPKAA
jgi:transposase